MEYWRENKFVNIHTHHEKSSVKMQSILNIFAQEASSKIVTLPTNQLISIGLHPWHLATIDENATHKLFENTQKLLTHPQVWAIGETGLDKQIPINLARQQAVFQAHIQWSEQYQKPLIVHCVKAYSEVLTIRKATKAQQRWILHGFNGSKELAWAFIEAGCKLSFGHLLFVSQSKACRLFPSLPLEACYLETDDKAELSIQQVYTQASNLRGIALEKLATFIQLDN